MVFVPEEDWKINLRLSLIKDRKASKFRNGFWCLFYILVSVGISVSVCPHEEERSRYD